MRRLRPFIIGIVALVLLVGPSGPASAQGADVFGPIESGEGDLETQEGLQSATPTDNVNELNTANGSLDNGSGGTGDPAQFDLGNGADQGSGDQFFDNAGGGGTESGNGGTVSTGISAFGGNSTQSAGNAAASGNQAPVNPPLNNPSLNNPALTNPALNQIPGNNPSLNNVPVNPSLSNSVPVNQVPANAQALMDQIADEPAPSATATQPATGTEELVPQAQAPAIEAPPLPPPNEFAGAPPVPGTMRLMAESEAPEEYAVQPGDTLYDICDQLLDEPGYWPKLWSLNPEIKNPHFIFPNMRLRFYPGDDDNPPYLQVVTEDDVIPIDKGSLDEQELIAEKVQFSVQEVIDEDRPVIEVIGLDQVAGDELGDQVLTSGGIYQGREVKVQVPGFIFAEEKEARAFVLGGRDGGVSLGPGQKVVVESAGGVAAGTLYTVLRPGEEIKDPVNGDFVGYKYYFVANIRLTRALEAEVFLGVVQDNLLGVKPEDILVDYLSTFRSVPADSEVGALAGAEANVVGFQFFGQELGAMGHFAFLDRGSGDGVSPGMYLPIFQAPGYLSSAFGSADLPADWENVAVIRVIDVTEAGAVGLVVRSSKEIRVGDRTKPG